MRVVCYGWDRTNLSGLRPGRALCRRMIELLGGQMWVQSEKGKWGSFAFSVPPTIQDKDKLKGETQRRDD